MKFAKIVYSLGMLLTILMICLLPFFTVNVDTAAASSFETDVSMPIEESNFPQKTAETSSEDKVSVTEEVYSLTDEYQEEINEEVEETANNNNVVDLKPKKLAYLTFDDGPSNNNTPRILDALNDYKIKATFFVNGYGSKELYERIVNEGHVIANHTYSHDYKVIYSSVKRFKADVDKLSDFLQEVTGKKPDILRFPGGSNNTVSHQYGGAKIMKSLCGVVVDEMGYQYFDWNVSSEDATTYKANKDFIVRSVLNGARGIDNAIILMHDSAAKTTTADALPEIIDGLKDLGFEFNVLTKETAPVQFESPQAWTKNSQNLYLPVV